MASAKALLGGLFGKYLFREARVSSVAERGAFREFEVEGETLRGAPFVTGDKVQFFLPEVGMRTYTPMSWSETRARFLGFLHGDRSTPGAAWLSTLAVGQAVQLFGPRRSLGTSIMVGGVLVVGDETSLALSVALTREHPVHAVLEGRQPREVEAVARELGVSCECVAFGDAERLARLVSGQLRSAGRFPLYSGRAATIQRLKRDLKREGLEPGGQTKAYWAEGKRGLD